VGAASRICRKGSQEIKCFDEERPGGMARETVTSSPVIIAINVQAFAREHKMISFCSYSVVQKAVILENFV